MCCRSRGLRKRGRWGLLRSARPHRRGSGFGSSRLSGPRCPLPALRRTRPRWAARFRPWDLRATCDTVRAGTRRFVSLVSYHRSVSLCGAPHPGLVWEDRWTRVSIEGQTSASGLALNTFQCMSWSGSLVADLVLMREQRRCGVGCDCSVYLADSDSHEYSLVGNERGGLLGDRGRDGGAAVG